MREAFSLLMLISNFYFNAKITHPALQMAESVKGRSQVLYWAVKVSFEGAMIVILKEHNI